MDEKRARVRNGDPVKGRVENQRQFCVRECDGAKMIPQENLSRFTSTKAIDACVYASAISRAASKIHKHTINSEKCALVSVDEIAKLLDFIHSIMKWNPERGTCDTTGCANHIANPGVNSVVAEPEMFMHIGVCMTGMCEQQDLHADVHYCKLCGNTTVAYTGLGGILLTGNFRGRSSAWARVAMALLVHEGVGVRFCASSWDAFWIEVRVAQGADKPPRWVHVDVYDRVVDDPSVYAQTWKITSANRAAACDGHSQVVDVTDKYVTAPVAAREAAAADVSASEDMRAMVSTIAASTLSSPE